MWLDEDVLWTHATGMNVINLTEPGEGTQWPNSSCVEYISMLSQHSQTKIYIARLFAFSGIGTRDYVNVKKKIIQKLKIVRWVKLAATRNEL